MKTLKQIGISLLTTLALGLFCLYVVPINLNRLNIAQNGMLGSSLTELDGQDTMSDFPTIYNANLNALNDDKQETASTSLPNVTTLSALTTAGSLATIGTIGTGVWQATDVGVAYGGTGVSTFGSNLVLLGNGTGALQTVTTGTDDQVLTLVGGIPDWTSVSLDESANYDWTGVHTGIGIVGEIIAYASSTAPIRWLLCDGSSLDTTTYADLFGVVGYAFGGSGANFSLPDLRGRFITMASSTTGVYSEFAETGGATSTTLTIDQMPAHTHAETITTGETSSGSNPKPTSENAATLNNTGSAGGGEAHSNVEPYLVLTYIIKY